MINGLKSNTPMQVSICTSTWLVGIIMRLEKGGKITEEIENLKTENYLVWLSL